MPTLEEEPGAARRTRRPRLLDCGYVRRRLEWVWPEVVDNLSTWAIFSPPGEHGFRISGYCTPDFDRRTLVRRR